MSTKEGDHGRATFNLRTGYQPTGPIRYPTFGSLVAKELGSAYSREVVHRDDLVLLRRYVARGSDRACC